MEDMKILFELIKENARVPLQENRTAKLVEPQAPDSSATIRNIPADAMIIKVDAFVAPDGIFNGKNDECKRADYVIISEEKKCIVYIELKRTKGRCGHIKKQLMGAQCFIKYCQEIGKSFWSERNFLSNYKSRFISIGHTSLAKRKTRMERPEGKHDSPERVLKIGWPHYLEFNKLAS